MQKRKPKEKQLRKLQPQQRRKQPNPPKDLPILPYRLETAAEVLPEMQLQALHPSLLVIRMYLVAQA